MPSGVGGPILPGVSIKPTETHVLTFKDGVWKAVEPAAPFLSATDLVVANAASPTELNSYGTAVPDWRLVSQAGATSDSATLYRLDVSSDSQALPYIVDSVTAGLKWVAVSGRYVNGEVTSATGVTAKPSGTAGVRLDPNSATGDFTLRISPANLTANRRTTLPDADLTITGGGTLALGGFTLTVPATGTAALLGAANAFTSNNTMAGTLELTTASNGLTISKTTGTTLIVSSTEESVSASTGSIISEGGITAKKTVYMSLGCTIEAASPTALLIGTGGSATRGVTITGSGGVSANYNGMFFNSNASGSGDTGAQYNTGLPTWRMALGGGAAEWNGADCFAIARVAAGGTVTSPSFKMKVDDSSTATHTSLLLYDVDNGTLERVTVGAADSGGAGFKVLRIPN